MAKPKPTITIGQLHFEDLDPHRFEDLVRQLIYEFRPWRQLEATGRAGSDDGFDARGFEGGQEMDIAESQDDDEAVSPADERQWLIQCKREKAIGPKKLVSYLDEIPDDEISRLHGVIVAAACNFSKKARDDFRQRIQEIGVGEAHLWGKGEIEDMLFQPKNDHLLFAYFGVSLQVRQRSLRTDVRARLATKNKAKKCLDMRMTPVLVRDASDDRYPYLDDGDDELDRVDRGRWLVYQFEKCRYDGVHLAFRRYMAFLDDDGEHWDYAEKMNAAIPHNNPWVTEKQERDIDAWRAAREEADAIWTELPDQNKGWYELFLIIPYENILALDEDGDEWFDGPHIYTVPFTRLHGPFADYDGVTLKTIGGWNARHISSDESKRVEKFPRKT